MCKLHLGCSNSYPGPIDGWDNLDIKKWNEKIIIHDLRDPLNYTDNVATACFTCHVLEHLTKQDGEKVIKECFRVLKPGCAIRVIVPSLEHILSKPTYADMIKDLYDADSKSGPHKYMYYEESLIALLSSVGFKDVSSTKWINTNSNYAVFKNIQSFHAVSLAVEGNK